MAAKAMIYAVVFMFGIVICSAQGDRPMLKSYKDIKTGAQQLDEYLPLLKGKKVGIVAHKASMVNGSHLVDTLLSQGVHIIRIFSPEHGFRGQAEAGEKVSTIIDNKTLIPLVSLYGNKRKPGKQDMAGIDVMVFDLQDVGVRFYTYISTLTYVMEACAAFDIPLIVLDRPNPNAFYVDGPVLDTAYRSFVGMHPVPIVYGMTIGEYAQMVNGEKWMKDSTACELQIIPMSDYKHKYIVKLPTDPSPNLPSWRSVYLYPSLCLFEGTIMSVGRGTDHPFEVYGHPHFYLGSYIFTPRSIPGKSAKPKFLGQNCYGQNLKDYASNYKYNYQSLNIGWLAESHKFMSQDHEFFNAYFDKLAGTDKLRKQIIRQVSPENIKYSWRRELSEFMKIREKYLLYD